MSQKNANTIERPKWLDTPEEPEPPVYVLDMYVGGVAEHEVSLTREEFISVKRHIAKLRGFEVADEAPQGGEEDDFLKTCRLIQERDYGTSTPAEMLITALVTLYRVRRDRFMPEVVEREFKQFQENFGDALRDAQLMVESHPELFAVSK